MKHAAVFGSLELDFFFFAWVLEGNYLTIVHLSANLYSSKSPLALIEAYQPFTEHWFKLQTNSALPILTLVRQHQVHGNLLQERFGTLKRLRYQKHTFQDVSIHPSRTVPSKIGLIPPILGISTFAFEESKADGPANRGVVGRRAPGGGGTPGKGLAGAGAGLAGSWVQGTCLYFTPITPHFVFAS